MSTDRTEALIAAIAEDARPVRVLASPMRRALAILAVAAAAGGIAIWMMADIGSLLGRYAGRERMMMMEMAAMLATGVLAVTGAFFLSVPGRSRLWLAAPIPTAILWLALSGMGCWRDLFRHGSAGWSLGHSVDCLLFILGAAVLIGAPLLWRLSRASPIDPLRVAALAGLGTAALSAFFLQFFHPLTVTFLDLGVHVTAFLAVIGIMALLRRRALGAAA